MLPGPLQIWDSGWVRVPPVAVSAEDVCLRPYSVEILMKFVTFLGSLHWPSAGNDLGPGGVSYVELLILYELWAGERLQFEKAVPRCRRVDRSISVSAVPFGPGIDIRRSCKLLGAMLRALCALLGGLGRFIPCAIGANHSRLRHIGWVKSGHGLTSRPRETSDIRFLDELLFSLWLPSYVWGCFAAWDSASEVLYVSFFTSGSYLVSSFSWWCCFACWWCVGAF